MGSRHRILKSLDPVFDKLDDGATASADQVIVVEIADLVTRLAVSEMAGDSHTTGDQELDRAVDRGLADARVALPGDGEELLDRDVSARGEKGIDDDVPLSRCLEPVLRHVGREESACFGSVLHDEKRSQVA